MSTHQSSPTGAANSLRKIVVVGCGLIGASIALALRRKNARVEILGVDRPGVLAKAIAGGIIDTALGETGAMDAIVSLRPDTIVLALPVRVSVELMPRLARICRAMEPGRRPLILDVGSVKQPIVALARLLECPRFVGGHPMTGHERGGIDNARADLFDHTRFVLCPATHGRRDLELARAFVRHLGADPIVLDAPTHDRAVAITSHVPHLVAWALMDAAVEQQARLGSSRLPWAVAAGSWHDATRVASADPAAWSEIVDQNRDAVLESLDALLAALGRIRDGLARGVDPLAGAAQGVPAAKLAQLARRRAPGQR